MAESISRNKDGVPVWDGSAATFQEYSELAEHWEQTIPYNKRYLCGPKLLNELSGTAKKLVMAKQPGWVSHNGGVQVLLNFLRQKLGLPQLAEVSDFMARYFKQSRRKRNESMNEYVTRKAELYARAEQALGRAQSRYQPTTFTETTTRTSASISQANSTHQNEPNATDFVDAEDGTSVATPQNSMEAADPEPDWWQQHENTWSSWDDWHWGRSHWGSREWWEPSYQGGTVSSQTWMATRCILLPDFVQGWFLLQDSGLETSEKNLILAALKGECSFDRVAQELRNQWSEDDLKRRDQGGRSVSAWMADEGTEQDPFEEDQHSPDMNYFMQSGMNAEGMALISEAEDEAQTALALMERGKRTLREARAKQHYVKMSRQYYGTSGKGAPFAKRDSFVQGKGYATQCLSCGGNHRTSDCPSKARAQASSVADHASDQAPFVCMTDQVLSADGGGAWKLSTQDAMNQGKAVIDGGATRTLGSVTALERLMSLRTEKHGDSGLAKLDLEQRPVFGFGNSSSDLCLSTAWLKIQAAGREGQLKVHTLDKGSGPILFSIETLRSLGAIIDFEHDLICFRKLSQDRVIQLEQSSSGHQLIPLVQDWYQESKKTTRPVPSLKDFI